MAKHGNFVWNELVTPDIEKSGKFFCDLVGWTMREVDLHLMGKYTVFQSGDQDVAGMMNPVTHFSKNERPFWSSYIAVDNVDECIAKVADLGGEVIAPPADIPDVGRVCMITDPAGAIVCLMTPVKRNVSMD